MKAKLLLIAPLLACLAAPVQADTERNMAISISPIAPIFGGVDLLYQWKVLDFLAITIPGEFYYSWLTASAVKYMQEKFKNGEITRAPFSIAGGIGARLLLNNKGLRDTFYIEPRLLLGYKQAGVKAGGIELQGQAMKFQPMLQFGWDWYWDYGLYMSLGAGLGYSFYFNQTSNMPDDLKDNWLISWLVPTSKGHLAFDGEFKVGYSW